MNPIKCLIVDDEELARTLLMNYTGRLPWMEVRGAVSNPLEAMEILRREPVDLLFLDIQMPELSGIAFLKSLSARPAVVFTTAYPEYALEGFNLDVVDYLLKPFSFERFLQAVNKVRNTMPATASGSTEQGEERDFIMVKSEHKIHRIRYEEILFIQSMREYAAFHTAKGRILSLSSLKSLEESLPPERFMRIHKSYIIPLDRVDTLEGNMVVLAGEKIPVGASYREKLAGYFS